MSIILLHIVRILILLLLLSIYRVKNFYCGKLRNYDQLKIIFKINRIDDQSLKTLTLALHMV